MQAVLVALMVAPLTASISLLFSFSVRPSVLLLVLMVSRILTAFSQRSEVSFSPVAAMFEMTVFSPSLSSVTVTVTSPLKPVAVPL